MPLGKSELLQVDGKGACAAVGFGVAQPRRFGVAVGQEDESHMVGAQAGLAAQRGYQ